MGSISVTPSVFVLQFLILSTFLLSTVTCLTGLAGVGVLGDGTTVNSFVLKSVLVEPSVLQGVLVRDVRVSSRFGILLSKSGQVYAWGSNMYGNIGLGTFDSKIYPPTEVFGALKGNIITDIAVNEDNALALDDKGVVYAWGANTYGTLGDGTQKPNAIATAVGGALKDKIILAISTLQSHCLALSSDGLVFGWGLNDQGQIKATSVVSPVTLPEQININDVIAIAAGGSHSIVLKGDNTLWAWGDSSHGALGAASTPSLQMVKVDDTSDLAGKRIRSITAGLKSTHVIADGELFAWGENVNGQLCVNTAQDQRTPLRCNDTLLQGKTFRKVKSSDLFVSAAITTDNKIYAWGRRDHGHFGEPVQGLEQDPVLLDTSVLANAIDFAVGPLTVHVWDNTALNLIEPGGILPLFGYALKRNQTYSLTVTGIVSAAFLSLILILSVPLLIAVVVIGLRKPTPTTSGSIRDDPEVGYQRLSST